MLQQTKRKHSKAVIVLLSSVLFTWSVLAQGIQRPATPNIMGVDLSSTGHIDITTSSLPVGDEPQCHAVLVSSLTASFTKAMEVGNTSGEGPVVYYYDKTNELHVDVADSTYERYFVAVAHSVKEGDRRIFSGWKVWTDGDGVPLTVSTNQGDRGERIYYKSRRIDTYSNNVVTDMTFSFKPRGSEKYSFQLLHNTFPVVEITDLAGYTAYNNIKDALENHGPNQDFIILKKVDNGFYQFTIYHIIKNYASTDSIKARIISSDNLVYDTTTNQVAVINDPGFIDIHTTIHNLIKIANDKEDPIYPGALETYNAADTLPAKLFIAAMLDLSLAHNSPQEKEQEIANGIFSSYMQFMDNIVRNWSVVGAIDKGFDRLEAIHNKVLDVNKGTIIDPVLVDFRGVTAEYGQPVKERNNWVFYEGYTRLESYIEKPVYNTGEKSGAGVMFRISDNIDMFIANPPESTNFFDEPFLTGPSERRYVLRGDNEDTLDKFETGGFWAKGSDITQGEQQYYIDIKPVRLPVLYTGNSFPVIIDTAFNCANEMGYNTDVKGKIVGGVEKSIFNILAIEKNGTEKIIENLENNNVLTIGNKRVLKYNGDYKIPGSTISYSVKGDIDDINNLVIYQQGNRVFVIDTGRFQEASIYLIEKSEIKTRQTGPVEWIFQRIFPKKLIGISLGIKEIDKDGFKYIYCDGINAVPVEIEKRDEYWLPLDKRNKGKIRIRWKNKVKIYRSENMIESNLLWPKTEKEIKDGYRDYNNWQDFQDSVLTAGYDYFYIYSSQSGIGSFEVWYLPENKNNSEIIFEIVNVTTIKITKLPLGKAYNMSNYSIGKVYIPTKYGGKLDITGAEDDASLFYSNGEDLTWDNALKIYNDEFPYCRYVGKEIKYLVPKDDYGWYYYKLKRKDENKKCQIINSFTQSKKVTKEPWNLSFYPIPDEQDPNLYDVNGPLYKYDVAFSSDSRSKEFINIYKYGHYCAKNAIIEQDAERTLGYDFNGNGSHDPFYGFDCVEGYGLRASNNLVHFDETGDNFINAGLDVSWWGHCNNATAVLICENEPSATIKTINMVDFTQDDKKGLLVALYHGFEGTVKGPDIKPHEWHSNLEKQIIGNNEMLGCDISNTGISPDIVWNYPIYEIKKMEYSERDGFDDPYYVDVYSEVSYWNYWDNSTPRSKSLSYYYCVNYEDGVASKSNEDDWISDVLYRPDAVWIPQKQERINEYWGNSLNYENLRSITDE